MYHCVTHPVPHLGETVGMNIAAEAAVDRPKDTYHESISVDGSAAALSACKLVSCRLLLWVGLVCGYLVLHGQARYMHKATKWLPDCQACCSCMTTACFDTFASYLTSLLAR
eukprot:jgi/Ulvmu1/11424/UM075_0090.1